MTSNIYSDLLSAAIMWVFVKSLLDMGGFLSISV